MTPDTFTPPLQRKNPHDNYIAIAKAIGMICVVIWHSRPPQWLGIFVMLFAVPLFFFTSGYFYRPSGNVKELKTFYVKRIKGLYLPFVKWSLLFLALHNVCYHLNIYNGEYGFMGRTSVLYTWADFGKRALDIVFRMSGQEQLLGAFWFIRALFISSLMVATVHFLFSRWKFTNRYVMLALLLPLTYLAVRLDIHVPLVGNLGLILLSTMFYVMGYCYRKIENDRFYTAPVGLMATLVTVGGIFYFGHLVEMLGIESRNVMPYAAFAATGIIMVLNISRFTEKAGIKDFLYLVGNNTMIILALHFTCMKLVSLLKITVYDWPVERLAEFPVITENNGTWWVAYVLSGVLIPLLLQVVYDRARASLNSRTGK